MFTVTTERGAYQFTSLRKAIDFLDMLLEYGELRDSSGAVLLTANRDQLVTM